MLSVEPMKSISKSLSVLLYAGGLYTSTLLPILLCSFG